MSDLGQMTAMIVSTLMTNKRYMILIEPGNYSPLDGLGVRAKYELDIDNLVKDAMTIALKIQEAERDLNRAAR